MKSRMSTACRKVWGEYMTGSISLSGMNEQLNNMTIKQLRLGIEDKKKFKPTTRGRSRL